LLSFAIPFPEIRDEVPEKFSKRRNFLTRLHEACGEAGRGLPAFVMGLSPSRKAPAGQDGVPSSGCCEWGEIAGHALHLAGRAREKDTNYTNGHESDDS